MSSMTTSHGVLPMHSINFQNCIRNVLTRGSDVTKGRWFGFFTSTAPMIMCHLQNPWMRSTLLQQSHECAVVTMSDLLMNFLQPIFDFFSLRHGRLSDTVGLASTTDGSDDGMSTSNQTGSLNWKQKDQMVAHRHRNATVPECPTRNSNCLSKETASPTSDTEIVEIAMKTH